MISYLITSWRENRDTLGDDRNPAGREALKAYGVIVAIGLILSLSAGEPSAETLSGVLTAFAIVAGFTFSALLFFVDHRFHVRIDPDSREQKVLQNKIDDLADELFININYFNLVCVLLIVACVVALVRPHLQFFTGSSSANAPTLQAVLSVLFAAGFYGMVGEAIFTFIRLLSRLRYLFGKVRESQKGHEQLNQKVG